MRRTRRANIRFDCLEDRSLPSFLAAPEVPVGPNGGDRVASRHRQRRLQPRQQARRHHRQQAGRRDQHPARQRAGAGSSRPSTSPRPFPVNLWPSTSTAMASSASGCGHQGHLLPRHGRCLPGNGLGGFNPAMIFPAGPGRMPWPPATNGDGRRSGRSQRTNGVSTITCCSVPGPASSTRAGRSAGNKPVDRHRRLQRRRASDLASVGGGSVLVSTE